MIIYDINYNLLFKNEEIHTISIDNKKLETDNIKKILEEQMEYKVKNILMTFLLDPKTKK